MKEETDDDKFIEILEDGVKKVLKDRDATAKDRLNAVVAGAKLLQIKHKISGSDGESNFFDK